MWLNRIQAIGKGIVHEDFSLDYELVRGALGSLKFLIRRTMEHVRSVRRYPYRQVSILPGVRQRRHGPVPSGQSVRKL